MNTNWHQMLTSFLTEERMTVHKVSTVSDIHHRGMHGAARIGQRSVLVASETESAGAKFSTHPLSHPLV
jgi:hypothetical protein